MDQSIESDKIQSLLRAWSWCQLCAICLMMVNRISRKANFVVSGKNKQHLSYFPASDGSSCVRPHAAILAHLCCWFVTRHDTPARSRGGSLKQEGASVTLVDSVFLVGYWKFTNGTVTFQHWQTQKTEFTNVSGARYLVRNSFPSPIKYQHRVTNHPFDWLSSPEE